MPRRLADHAMPWPKFAGRRGDDGRRAWGEGGEHGLGAPDLEGADRVEGFDLERDGAAKGGVEGGVAHERGVEEQRVDQGAGRRDLVGRQQRGPVANLASGPACCKSACWGVLAGWKVRQ